MKTFIHVQCLFLNIFSRCNQENTQKIKKTNKKGIFKCIEFIFCDITMIVYSIALSRYLTTTERILFVVSKLLLNIIEEVNRSQIFMGQKIRRLQLMGHVKIIQMFCRWSSLVSKNYESCVFFQKHTFFILSTKTVGFRENATLKYFICISK